ncbi:MAG: hypothetical protein GOMPHAMPRED_007989 [Gomphillus americanus]|uniref:Peroxisomal membrane protein PEX16 n=1 Tax=Gomphillus americanus TaxID=1940652 RepID=A0A8H3ICS7_9LECA|nr:MAG: hypothetical protein GOMPHAMPRED_007989 [Gomphillus americanus]
MLPEVTQIRKQSQQSQFSQKSLVRMYENFVSENASSVSQIESALRSLTYIIPGRFKESELASESLHSFIQLLSLYHTSLLSKVYNRLPSSIPRPNPSLHNRYTKFWSSQSTLYRRIAQLLQIIQYTELLWEMLARRRGQKTRWRVVMLIESIKAFCRLLLMRLTNSRPLIHPLLPEREVDPRNALEQEQQKAASDWNGMDQNELPEQSNAEINWVMPRTGLSLPTLPNTSDITEYLMKKVLTPDDVKAPKQLLHKLTTIQAQAAEIMWIVRPVIYAALLSRYQGSKKSSWTPWLVGVSIEAAARQLSKNELSLRIAGGLRGVTGLEKEEIKSRRWNMAWWALRGAFYENITKSWIQGAAGKLKGKMLLDIVATVIEDYDYLWDEYYFSTATM